MVIPHDIVFTIGTKSQNRTILFTFDGHTCFDIKKKREDGLL